MKKPDFSNLNALFINCTLKKSPRQSHTRGLIDVSMKIMEKEGVEAECIRFADYDIAPGVYPDMKEYGVEKDDWPEIWEKVNAADILVIGTPIWLGEKSSEATKLIERLYSMSGLQNEKGQYIYYGKVGGCVITGNEDGIKHCAMNMLYSLQHVGYSIPPQADCGWIGEAGPGPSYLDKESNAQNNQFTNRNTTFMTYNLLHLASMLKVQGGYSNYGNSREAWDDGTRWNFENPEYR
ncbi:flavodoxin family protein [Rhodohalobacter sp.]|uniref:flavodoxin family protein n=1 Tax=Rhodohalobacter sp. TaxID=1974210 RepID=UPI002ACDB648|nr:flavodoxin family protein [Rhodohalobacter sp.]MDZ7755543.1 flavodoxin family protein [Rhodohalobacter sp.]